jgi:hypothetical protein
MFSISDVVSVYKEFFYCYPCFAATIEFGIGASSDFLLLRLYGAALITLHGQTSKNLMIFHLISMILDI